MATQDQASHIPTALYGASVPLAGSDAAVLTPAPGNNDQASPLAATGLQIFTIQAAPGDLTINLELDANAQTAPSYYIAGWETAANLLSQIIKDPITVNLELGYTEIPGFNEAEPNGGASSGPAYDITDSYQQVRSFLLNDGSSQVVAAVNDLPNTTSLNGQTEFSVAAAEAKVWGQLPANDTAIDGDVGFGTNIPSNTIVGVALHEFTHAMGRVPGDTVLSLFRYTSPGVHDFESTLPAPASYFSIDGGNTILAQFGQDYDNSDFLNAPGVGPTGYASSTLTPTDPFDEFYVPGTTQQSLTPLDLTVLEMLGFNETPAPSPSPVVLNDFGWQQGWGSPDNPRVIADVNGDGTSDYIGFGDQYTFIAYGGTFANGQGQIGPGFSTAVASIDDFGTDEGYTASVQRGAAATGFGVGDSIYGQGYAGIYWYGATGESPQPTADTGISYEVLSYQATPNFYGNFGSQEGWNSTNGFQILKADASDPYASILGFGDNGIVVGPQAFAPGATAANSYVIPLAVGNAQGWNQNVDIRTFQTTTGTTIDLNGDGIADFVGMGPAGLVYAYGNMDGPGGTYELGTLQTAQIDGTGDDLGEAQGWTDATTLRYVVADPATGYDDIIAFGAAGVYVSMGQNPATHNGQPFGQLYLALADFGTNQGWSVSQTPRIIGDVNGDGIPDIVGFGDNSTFVAFGSRAGNGNLQFAIDPTQTIANFGASEGWSGANPQTVRALGEFAGKSDLILTGAYNTQVYQFG